MNTIRDNVIKFLNDNISNGNVRQIDLANYLGVSKVNVYHWIKGVNAPDVNLYPKIAEFFGVSIIELMGLGDELVALTEKERKLIESYRAASDETKEIIHKILDIK